MPVIFRGLTLFALALALAILPFTLAVGPQSCSTNQFWFPDKSSCLPRGGLLFPFKPPAGKDCPPSDWYWAPEQGCCVPQFPLPPFSPPPQCSNGWLWAPSLWCCTPPPSKPNPPPSKPSSNPWGGQGWKRELDSNSCKPNEFWYAEKNSCLPRGGQPHPPTPPTGKSCPPSGWYWASEQGSCVPQYPQPPHPTPPQCSSGWNWIDSLSCCEPNPSKPNSPPSRPSGNPWGGHGWKRSRIPPLSEELSLCPSEFEACPVPTLSGFSDTDYECLDTSVELTSCGGCLSTGAGQDCSAIEHANNVGCDNGVCQVFSCKAGYFRNSSGTSCVAALTAQNEL